MNVKIVYDRKSRQCANAVPFVLVCFENWEKFSLLQLPRNLIFSNEFIAIYSSRRLKKFIFILKMFPFNNQQTFYSGQHQPQYEITIDEDESMPNASAPQAQVPKASPNEPLPQAALRSTVVKKKGRGFSSATSTVLEEAGSFEHLQQQQQLPLQEKHQKGSVSFNPYADYDPRTRAQRSIEGWTVILSGLHEEQPEDELRDACADFGPVHEVRMPLDHRTGFVKGWALVDFDGFVSARQLIEASARGRLMILGKPVAASWAFFTEPYTIA